MGRGTARARSGEEGAPGSEGSGAVRNAGDDAAGCEDYALDQEPADALFARHRLQPRAGDDRLLASGVLASGSATRTRSDPRRRVGAVFPLPPFRGVRATPLMTLLYRDPVG